MVPAEACNIRVVARFKPRSHGTDDKENAPQQSEVVLDPKESTVTVFTSNASGPHKFTLDAVLGATSRQQEVYDVVARTMIPDCLHGFNATLLAYGQTGAGKTYTMFGRDCVMSAVDESAGIIPRAGQQLFDCIEAEDRGMSYTIKCSFFEIYNEDCYDLLSQGREALRVRESLDTGVYLEGLEEVCVTCPEGLIECLLVGNSMRSVSAVLAQMWPASVVCAVLAQMWPVPILARAGECNQHERVLLAVPLGARGDRPLQVGGIRTA